MSTTYPKLNILNRLSLTTSVQMRTTRALILMAPILIALVLLALLEIGIAVTPLDDWLSGLIGRDLQVKNHELFHSNAYANTNTLFVGTSRTLYGFATPAFNQSQPSFKAYNLGLAGSDLNIHRLLLDEFIEKYGKPKLLLIELSEFQLGRGGLSQNSVHFLAHEVLEHPATLPELLKSPDLNWDDKSNLLLSVASRLYRYRSVLDFRSLTKQLFHPAPVEPLNTGWIGSTKVRNYLYNASALGAAASTRFDTLMKNRHPVNHPNIVGLITACQTQHIPVVLVSWPLHPIYQNHIHQDALGQQVLEQRRALSKRYHVPFIELDQGLSLDDARYFNDMDHLNRTGAIRFTRILAQRLNKLSL